MNPKILAAWKAFWSAVPAWTLKAQLLCGAIAGFSLFMIATIVNISLTKHLSVQHLMMDCIWQMSEQVVGGMVIVFFKIVIHEPQIEHA